MEVREPYLSEVSSCAHEMLVSHPVLSFGGHKKYDFPTNVRWMLDGIGLTKNEVLWLYDT